ACRYGMHRGFSADGGLRHPVRRQDQVGVVRWRRFVLRDAPGAGAGLVAIVTTEPSRPADYGRFAADRPGRPRGRFGAGRPGPIDRWGQFVNSKLQIPNSRALTADDADGADKKQKSVQSVKSAVNSFRGLNLAFPIKLWNLELG